MYLCMTVNVLGVGPGFWSCAFSDLHNQMTIADCISMLPQWALAIAI